MSRYCRVGEAMRGQVTIEAREVVADIRAGVTDFQLVEKYGVTPRGLDTLIRHLVDWGLITEQELEDRQQFTDSLIIRTFLESRRDIKIID